MDRLTCSHLKESGAVAILLFLTGCGQFIYFDGPYHGKVIEIDPETQSERSIAEAAVLAVWWRESGLLVPHPIESVHDAQETLTDENGDFTIPGTSGLTLNPTARIKEPIFIIFRPRYETYGGWRIKPKSVRRTIKVSEKDGRTVIELRRFAAPETPQQRQEQLENLTRLFVPSDVPPEKYRNLLRLKDEERIRLGLKPLSP